MISFTFEAQLRHKVNMSSSFCFNLYLWFQVPYLYSHTTRTWHHEFQERMLGLRQDWIFGNKSKATEEKSDKDKEDHMKKPAPFPSHQNVYRQGRLMDQSHRGVHDNTKDSQTKPSNRYQSEHNWWVGQPEIAYIQSSYDWQKTECCTPYK
jgi:hypothetical protein